MKNWQFILLLIILSPAALAKEKFKGIDFPYDWQGKNKNQSFIVQQNSILTSSGNIDYEAYYLKEEIIFRFVMISEVRGRKKITVLQWIDGNTKAHMFRLVKKRKFFFFVRKKWVEEAWRPRNDFQRLFKLIVPDLASGSTTKSGRF